MTALSLVATSARKDANEIKIQGFFYRFFKNCSQIILAFPSTLSMSPPNALLNRIGDFSSEDFKPQRHCRNSVAAHYHVAIVGKGQLKMNLNAITASGFIFACFRYSKQLPTIIFLQFKWHQNAKLLQKNMLFRRD